jgi:hypothetical protein
MYGRVQVSGLYGQKGQGSEFRVQSAGFSTGFNYFGY